MKQGFARSEPIKPPPAPKAEPVTPPAPLKIAPPEGKSLLMVAVAIGVIGLVIGLIVVLFASGARTFATGGAAMSIFPLFMVGTLAFMLGGRGGQKMPKAKLDALRARFLLMIDELRATVSRSADVMDISYRWYHPAPATLEAAVGSARMWERNPDGKDPWFGVGRAGTGMTNLGEAGVVEWQEPQDMPTDIELEPATGKVLEEFVRAQSAAYGTPALISLLVEPGYELRGPRERVLGLMRAILCQLVFSHGPDHLRLIVVTSDRGQWDWVKWLPHCCDPSVHDGAGPVRMVYRSATAFVEAAGDLLRERGQFTSRHGASREPVSVPHTVVVCDTNDDWSQVSDPSGVDGVTFFALRGGVPVCADPQRVLHVDSYGVISAVPRHDKEWVAKDEGPQFFAVADEVSFDDAEGLVERMARWRLAQAYESFTERIAVLTRRDILAHYGIDDPADIDFGMLWGARRDPLGGSRLRVPFGNRSDNGELLFLDMKSLDEGGDGPHGVMSGTTGSGKSTLVRTVIESLMLAHPPEELQFVLADLKGGSAVKPFNGVPHVSRIITDLEEDQALMERFLDALWGEIARRKAVCDSAGVDDAREYNETRARMRARGQDMAPLPMLVVVIDEFYEWFRIMPTAIDTLDAIGRQGRAYWIHLMMASQTIESRAEKLMENMGYRLVLKARTAGAAQAAGVPAAVNLPAQAGLGYFRKSGDEITRFQAEFMWREYHTPGAEDHDDGGGGFVPSSFFAPRLFTTDFVAVEEDGVGDLPVNREVVDGEVVSAEAEDKEDDEAGQIRTPKVGTVIIDQLRRIDFEPYRLWQPPLDEPVAIDELVNRFLGRPWQENYGAVRDLVFPIGVIDRPYKHDQPPWTVDTAGPGSNVLILGAGGAGKTTALQTLICSAALTHTPEQVQFYCLAYSGTALTTVAGLPHVGAVAGPTDPYGVRRTIAEVLGVVTSRKRSFLEHEVPSMEVFRRRKFAGAPGGVPDDGFGDLYLVLDNYRALAEENEVLIEQVNTIINQGPSFGVHVVVAADRESELRPVVRSGFGSRVELRMAANEDTKLVRAQFAKAVPPRPGRGMIALNYARLDADPQSGLHTLIARPALASTTGFESGSVAAAVGQVAVGKARAVRRLPARFELNELRVMAGDDHRQGVGAGGIAWAVSELDLQPVYLNFDENAHLVITGRRECGRTTTLATIMSEIGRVYAPGASSAPSTSRRSAEVWLVDPRRQLLTALGPDYMDHFAYNVDGVSAMADNLAAVLAGRQPPPGLSAEELLSKSWWSGPEIFLIIDDLQQLPAGFDSPLHKAAAWVTRAADVGLHVIVTRTFGGWSSSGSDPILRALHQANAPLLVMDADPDEGFIRAKMKGGPLPAGRGLLMAEDTGVFVQVAATRFGSSD